MITLEETVVDMMTQGKRFTAYSIYKLVDQRGTCHHYGEVISTIRGMWEDGVMAKHNYTRRYTYIHVGSSKPRVYIYHHVGEELEDEID